MKVRWYPKAVEEIAEIRKYIEQDSERYALIIVSEPLKCARSAAVKPYLGRMVPEVSNSYVRERIFRNYRVIYRIKDEFIEIIAVRHSAMNSITFDDLP